MGHLINPIAFRLGWTRQWVDDFFVELRFYPELLHKLLRFRYFLNCFFSATSQEPLIFNHYLISHFTFFLHVRGFFLRIFFYSSRVSLSWYSFFDKISELPFGIRFFPKKWEQPPAFSPWNRKSFFTLFLFYHLSANGSFDEVYEHRVAFFKAFESSLQPQEFKDLLSNFKYSFSRSSLTNYSSLSYSEIECFLLLQSIRNSCLQDIGRFRYIFRGSGVRFVNYEAIVQKFFHSIFLMFITRPFLRILHFWLSFLGSRFFLRDSFFIRFYQIGNDHVSARFLARFLAIRFGQGFSVRSLLNPIKRDLRLTKKLAARYFFRVKSRALSLLKSRRVSFSRLELLFALAQKFEKKFYQKLRCRWSSAIFFLHFHFSRFVVPGRLNFKKVVVYSKKKITKAQRKRISEISRVVKKERNRRRFFYKFARVFYWKKLFYGFLTPFITFSFKLFFSFQVYRAFLSELFGVCSFSYENSRELLNMSSPFSFRALGLSSLLQLSGGAFATFLSFSASARKSSRSFDSLFNVNRRNLRFYSPPAQGLHGFRIRLHGRFTRKQIASSYNFQDGIISLNSMDSFIDYGFSTIPIRNSSIGIKVWLNRDYNSPSYDATLAF